MHGMEVTLPGGLSYKGELLRQAEFLPLTGKVEQALIDLDKNSNRPGYVTSVLISVLHQIGARPVDVNCVSDLCMADRQYLMIRLAAMLKGEHMWLNVNCVRCHSMFDVEVSRSDLPVKEAGHGFPQLTLCLNEDTLCLRVPTGRDQQNIVELSDEMAMQKLLRACITSVNGEPASENYISELSASDIEILDLALDETAPAVCSQLLVTCPECDCEQHAELDHYDTSGKTSEYFFYNEIHTLASHYHWSEEAILNLPQSKRRLYIDLINRSSGNAGYE